MKNKSRWLKEGRKKMGPKIAGKWLKEEQGKGSRNSRERAQGEQGNGSKIEGKWLKEGREMVQK